MTRVLMIIGLLGACVLTAVYVTWRKTPVPNYVVDDSISGIARVLSTLDLLRKGDTNGAISKLEQMLDSEIITLSHDIPSKVDPSATSTVARLTEYRRRFPRETSDLLYQATISNAFLKVERTYLKRNH